jgi:hypothetical protein
MSLEKPEYNKEEVIKKMLDADTRGQAIKAGKVPELDAARRAEQQTKEVREQAGKPKMGSMDPKVLAEASKRKMHAGGVRPLKDFIADVLREQAAADKATE